MPRLFMAAVALACLAGLALACFGGVLFDDRQFAFRDAGHYYYPLHLRVQQEWEAGRWPLWAPEANGGVPLLGNPTAAVLYPGKALFFLLPYATAARFYVVAHVLLAVGAMGVLLRGWGISAMGASLGALAYGFGAPVLSQTCNVIFLVGAAWAPLGFLAADQWLRCARRRALPCLALVLAMMVLGGDPEAAYVTLVSAGFYAAGLTTRRAQHAPARLAWRVVLGSVPVSLALLGLAWWSARARQAAAGGAAVWHPPARLLVLAAWMVGALAMLRRALRGPGRDGLARAMGGLAYAAVLALLVAAAQVLPVLESVRLSYRAAEEEGHHDIYPFSTHPLLFMGALWPNLFGSTACGNRAWSVALPPRHEDNLWMPSLYLGGLTLVFAAAAAGGRGGPPWRAWLTGVAAVTALAALGSYGSPLLWARAVPGGSAMLGPLDAPGVGRVRLDGLLQDGDGGLYWLLASVLPGFGAFRFPAKLLVFTALGVCGLSGAGWDRLTAGSGSSRRAGMLAAWLLGVSLTALAAAWGGGALLLRLFHSLAAISESGYGPLDIPGVVAGIRGTLAQAAVVYAAAALLVRAAGRRPRFAGSVAVALLALDLGAANARHLPTAPQSAFESVPRAWELIRAAESKQPARGPFRVQRVGLWWPAEWSGRGSPDRLEEMIRWERDTLRPNHALPLRVPMTFVFDTTSMIDYTSFLFPWKMPLDARAAAGPGLKPGQEVYYYPRRGFDLWNTRYLIVPSYVEWDSLARAFGAFIPATTQVYPPPGTFSGPDGPARRRHWESSDDFRLLRNDAAYPRAWIVHQARVVPPADQSGPAGRRRLSLEILYPNDALWHEPRLTARDPHRLAWIETDRPASALAPFLSRAGPDPSESVRITRDEPQCVALRARLRTPGVLVVADAFYPGWTLTVDGKPAEILRANRAMRGVALEAGSHELIFRYQPLSLPIGLGLSAVGLIVLTAHGAWSLRGGPNPDRSARMTDGR